MLRGTLVALLVVALGGCGYNRVVELREGADAAWAQLDAQLQRRTDLVPNLVAAVRRAGGDDRAVLERVVNARARLLAGGTRDQKIAAAEEMTAALGSLLTGAGAEPAAAKSPELAKLVEELAGTAGLIAADQQRYDQAVAAYNAHIEAFPQVVYAEAMGFEPLKPIGAAAAPEPAAKTAAVTR